MTKGNIRVGIGGWTYEPWRGVFFPAGLPYVRELEFATRQLTTIEVNGTYYRSQKPEIFAKWRDTAPDDFVFTVKASRFCTNRRVLAEGAESIRKFLNQGLTELGPKLGPILWQFLPTKRFDPDDFATFLHMLPAKQDGVVLRHAVEVRHESFKGPAFVELMRAAGAAIVIADSDEYPRIEADTAPFTYARYMRAREEVPSGYGPDEIDRIAASARQWAKGGDAFILMINGAKIRAPAAARALIDRLEWD